MSRALFNIIGKHVKYFDYVGDERFGTIIAAEPYPMDPEVAYVYIEDEDPEYNIHEDFVGGTLIKYAEIRPSTEVYPD